MSTATPAGRQAAAAPEPQQAGHYEHRQIVVILIALMSGPTSAR